MFILKKIVFGLVGIFGVSIVANYLLLQLPNVADDRF